MSRIPVLYLAPWVDFGGTDKGTIDWFRWIDRTRFAPSLITTQPSPNRRLGEVAPYAEEVWVLPDLFVGEHYPKFILDFIVSREVRIVHVMNARLGFDLLPDLRGLPDRPRVVVQLHVEEESRDGYVRYVTTRYGNLVDSFSVTSAHLGEAVAGYGIASDRIDVIPTGVDAEREFSPDAVTPRALGSGQTVQILYPGRLVEQKDPLLMVEVAAELQRRGLDFRIHVVGDGALEPAVRARVTELGLFGRVTFEPPTRELAPWYAGCDLLLMTSVFEGVPYVIYEAMAMSLPVVAPALPGNVELMDGVGGALVQERSPAAFADALEPLIRSEERRRSAGAAGRERVRAQFSLREMADRHGELYDRLLATATFAGRSRRYVTPQPRISFAARPSHGTPLVSVITPCFNHGRWLRECVDSVLAQTYPAVEMIVADDGSTEDDTRSYLAELEAGDAVRVVRLERNSGPSAARNRALELAQGRYILPLDSDNLLLADAISRLVTQLQQAGEHVGFVYPSIQYFGNREEYFEPPSFNAWLLTQGNYIDTCALIDRDVFDAGVRYPDDIVLGHEDWDFFLTLLERGIHGEPARGKTLRYRKHGFTRSDIVDTRTGAFHQSVPDRHPDLYELHSDAPGDNPHVWLKARWAPSLTVVALEPVSAGTPSFDRLMRGVQRQRLRDFELYAFVDRQPAGDAAQPPVRALPTRLRDAPGETIAFMLDRIASPNLLFTYGSGIEFLAEAGGLQRVSRLLEQGVSSGVLVFADAWETEAVTWGALPGDDPSLWVHSLAISRRHKPLREMPEVIDATDPIGSLARTFQPRRISVDWRHLPLHAARSAPEPGRRVPWRPTPRPRSELSERSSRMDAPTLRPGTRALPPRWGGLRHWAPSAALPIVRHLQPSRRQWVISNSVHPPEYFVFDRILGVGHTMSFPGTRRLVEEPGGGWATVERGTEPDAVEMERTRGYLDQVPLPLLEPLMMCRHAETGGLVVVCGEDDPLNAEVEWPQVAVLGWIDRWPIGPVTAAHSRESTAFLRGLIRTVDAANRCHRTAIGAVPAGQAPWELGALLDRDPGRGISAWTDANGRLHTHSYVPARHPASIRRTARWTAAPLKWRGAGPLMPRARAAVRRGIDAAGYLAENLRGAPIAHDGTPQGWLLPDDGPQRVAIYSAIHPATSDQLVTRDPSEARELGYEAVRMVGFALGVAPITGALGRPSVAIPWASRFGTELSQSEDPLNPKP